MFCSQAHGRANSNQEVSGLGAEGTSQPGEKPRARVGAAAVLSAGRKGH